MKQLVRRYQLDQVFTATEHHQQGEVTYKMAWDLNKTLYRYDITSPDLIRFFLGGAAHESRDALTEAGWLSEAAVRNWCLRYEPGTSAGKRLGNTQPGDGYKFRGAGYIQLSGRSNFERFSSEIGDPRIISEVDSAKYVANNYAWEAAGWWWDHNDMNNNIARSQRQGLSNTAIFRQVSHGLLGGYDRTGIPAEWSDRLDRYNEVVRIMG